MLKFNLKLKNSDEIVIIDQLNSNNLNISLKLKGLISGTKFSSIVNFKIKFNGKKNIISDLVIKKINIESSESDSNSSEELICMSNVYTMCILDDNSSNSNHSQEKKIYKIIKSFIKSIRLKVHNHLIQKINFSIENSKINRLLIKGKIKN